MSVLVFAENVQGKFKKSCFEAVSYAKAVASQLNMPLVAVSTGTVADNELALLGKYGADKVLHCTEAGLDNFNAQAFATVVAAAATAEQSKVVVISASFSGKGLAPGLQ
jgi:electron transfer flavoprotein alpha subunit